MFHATLDSTKTWKQIVDALATLLTDAHLVVSESGIALHQLDSSKAAMVNLNLPAGVFQEYVCKGEHDVCLGIDELVKVSKRMAGDDRLEFDLNTNEQRFEIKMLGQAERKFSLQLLTPPEARSKSPSLKHDTKAEMFADSFKQAVKDIGVVSNHIKITANSDTIVFRGEGDTGEAEVSLKKGDDESALFDLKVDGDSHARYSLSYLAEIAKAMAGDSVILNFSTNKPIVVEFGIAESGRISFVLAPIVEQRWEK
ncbi:MAG: proliferating cell nuclear antigen (pcna) [Candidatus Thorarchaeota archaeon]|nr:proliferating cell nuclear antigen (pcna) [Candidatus Thorarchaeota archaeon]